jgi:hypothetical protein
MRTIRNASFLMFVLTMVIVANRPVYAVISCGTSGCGAGQSVETGGCSWNINVNGSPQNCGSAYDTCSSFCSNMGGVAVFHCSPTHMAAGDCACANPRNCGGPVQCDCNGSEQCCISQYCQGTWNPESLCTWSPLLINLRDNSANYHLTTASEGVWFDLNAVGGLERVAWTLPNSTVAFLVLDRNGNELIDNGSELFGTATVMRDGSRAANGFDALLDLDGGEGVSDHQIDSTDPHYSELRLWVDANHNGHSEQGELVSLADAGVLSILTDYADGRRVDRNGNMYRYKGIAYVQARAGHERRRRVFDVFLTATH